MGANDDVYRAFEHFKFHKTITDYYIYPFLARLGDGLSPKKVNQEILEVIRIFFPDSILWMHTTNLAISRDALRFIKSLHSNIVMGYWDGDLYSNQYRRVPRQMLELATECDVVFLQGFGETSEHLRRHGCHDIRYIPAFADPIRFKKNRNRKKRYDVVMIGNNIESKNPFRRTMRGTKLRQEIAKTFSEYFGDKFAVFGFGWKGTFAKGTVEYLKQDELCSLSRITIGVNNYNSKYYFSDRLPIAMISGTPIIHSYEPGYEEVFVGCEELRFFKTAQEALDLALILLSEDQAKLDIIGDQLNSFAVNHLTSLQAFGYMIDVLKYLINQKQGNKEGNDISNPWIKELS